MSSPAWTFAQTRGQLRAVAVLRWRIFRNNLRRKSGKGDLLANLVIVPIFLAFIFLPATGAAFGAFFAVSQNRPALLALILWGIFFLGQFTSIQLGQPDTVFDPTQLIRFPLAFRHYALLRVFFGLLGPSNLFVTVCSLAVVIGLTMASPSLSLWAVAALAAFLVANIFFTRMVFSWVDRWLSTRRAREIFTAFIFAFSLAIQWANFSFNPAYSRSHASAAELAHRLQTIQRFWTHAQPLLGVLPPGLTVRILIAAALGHPLRAMLCLGAVLLYAAVFFAIFALRLHREFRGENLSDAANAAATAQVPAQNPKRAAVSSDIDPSGAATANPFSSTRPASPLSGCTLDAAQLFIAPPQPPANPLPILLGKEFLTLRRTTGIFYAILAPLVLVMLFVARLSARTPAWFLYPACVAYTLFGVLPLAFNTLGMEAAGVQFYFLAPLGMRPVMVAKNIMIAAMIALEIAAVTVAIALAGSLPPALTLLAVLLWAAAVALCTFAAGNRRSITAPKKIDPAKAAGKQASPLSALLSMGILLASMLLGGGSLYFAHTTHRPWLLPAAMAPFAALAALVYIRSLGRIDRTVARHRDTLLEVLCKGA